MKESGDPLPMTRQEVRTDVKEFISDMEIQEVQFEDPSLEKIEFSHASP